jgi:hypothetical protein
MRATLLLGTIALSAGGWACGSAGGASGPWISQSPGWTRQPDASVAAAANGLVALVWVDVSTSGQSAVGYAFSTDGGTTFEPPSVFASPSGAIASDPTVAVAPDRSFHAAWVGYRTDALGTPSAMHVYTAQAPPGATRFGPAVEVTDPADDARYDKPWIQVTDAGTVVVVYQRVATPLDVGVVAAQSQDGATWARSFVADDPSGAVFRDLAYPCASGGRLWVAYLAGETSFDVRLARSDDGGQTWAPEIKVSEPGDPVAFDDPSCVADGDDVWVAYGRTKDTPYDEAEVQKLDAIVLARSNDGGATIASRASVGDAAVAPYFMHPQIAREPAGALDLVYYTGGSDDDPNGTFRRSRAADPASSFAPSVQVDAPITFLSARADPRWVGDYPGVFALGTDLYMGYVVNASGDAHVAFAKATNAAP